MKKFKVAVVQFEIEHHNPEKNLIKAEMFIKKASKNADVIIFPEDFITGPIRGKKSLADGNKKYLQRFQNWALQYGIDIIPGSIIEKENGKLFNKTYYIDFKGKVKGEYRKINLWHPERSCITPGDKICVFNNRFGKTGLIICWDLTFPEIFREMAKLGVKIIFCPSYWSIKEGEIGLKYNNNFNTLHVNSLCTVRAFENNIILVYCNAVGKLLGKNNGYMIGRSQITAPFYGPIKRLDYAKEEMFIHEVDTDILKDAKKVYRIKS